MRGWGRKATIAIAAILAAWTVWGYLPAIGRSTPRPDLDAFFDPGFAHGTPHVVRSARGVYLRLRLDRPVPPWYAHTYSERLRERGLEPRAWGDSPYRPFARLRGYNQHLVRETRLHPYTIEYRHLQIPGSSWPVSLRYPWLLCRLGAGLDDPREAVLVPDRDVAAVNLPEDWRYPGAVVADVRLANQMRPVLWVDLVAPAPAERIRSWVEEVHREGWKTRVDHNYVYADAVAPAPGQPGQLSYETGFSLYWLEFPVYSRAMAAQVRRGFPGETWIQQSALLPNLPDVSRYRLSAVYADDAQVQEAFARLTLRAIPPLASSLSAR